VFTTLFGFAMPFIRYRVGDFCSFSPKPCSCGSALPLIDHPEGRELDAMKLPSGKILSTLRFGHILAKIPGIHQWRVIQNDHTEFVLQLVMNNRPDEQILAGIRAQFLEFLAEPITLDIELMDRITDDAPKFRTFISKVRR
jgi:phenylacetate-CoA ligase